MANVFSLYHPPENQVEIGKYFYYVVLGLGKSKRLPIINRYKLQLILGSVQRQPSHPSCSSRAMF